MRIFSQLDSTASSHREMTGRAYDDDRSYESLSWPPSLYSSSSATIYPNSSSSGNCYTILCLFAIWINKHIIFSWFFTLSTRAKYTLHFMFSTCFDLLFQGVPFMPVPPLLFSSYTYPPAVKFTIWEMPV